MKTKLFKKFVLLFAILGVIAIFCGSIIYSFSGNGFENDAVLKGANKIASAGFILLGLCTGYGMYRLKISYANLFQYYLSRTMLFPLAVNTVIFLTISAVLDFLQPSSFIAEGGNMIDNLVGLVSAAPFWIVFSIFAGVMSAIVIFSKNPKLVKESSSTDSM